MCQAHIICKLLLSGLAEVYLWGSGVVPRPRLLYYGGGDKVFDEALKTIFKVDPVTG
jgi:hypothetical protein